MSDSKHNPGVSGRTSGSELNGGRQIFDLSTAKKMCEEIVNKNPRDEAIEKIKTALRIKPVSVMIKKFSKGKKVKVLVDFGEENGGQISIHPKKGAMIYAH